MDDREKEIEEKIREFDRQQLLTELRFKRLKELDEVRTTEPHSKAKVKRAEQRALEAYDTNIPAPIRIAYRDGYEQAEKDMMGQAVETVVSLEAGGFPVVEFGVGKFGLKVGDKVKVIIVKEDEK